MTKVESRESHLALPGQHQMRPPRRWRTKVHQNPPKVEKCENFLKKVKKWKSAGWLGWLPSQPANQPASRPASQRASEPASQRASETASQRADCLAGWLAGCRLAVWPTPAVYAHWLAGWLAGRLADCLNHGVHIRSSVAVDTWVPESICSNR